MILLSAQNIAKTYMERKVLDDVSFFLNEGDKVGIIGINGTGKSTLLRILAGAEEPDSGNVIRTNGIRISYLPQIPEFEPHGSVLEQVMLHLPADLKEAKTFEAKSILGKLGITDETRDISTLSGGEKRRAGIAAALIQPSDVLLLDEPTNHIDNETVRLLEEQLLKYRGAIVMVTHDRYFLNRITRKIVEVVEWIRRGVRARGTKSKDRIARFHELENREKPAEAEKMQLQSVSSRLGKKTVEIHAITKAVNGRMLIHDFSYQLPRDARIGIVGQNGAGKSTLIKMLCGQISPDNGSIELGDTVRIGYFSQECESMDPNQRVIDYIRETAERIQTPDGTVTAATMLERFLFTSELQWNRIEKLSGGERKRLYLLKVLMTAPNVLLLDEPTNDLDIATLTILEDYLRSFQGAVLAISHDRYFLDKMASEIWELTGNGEVRRYNGNYQDYMEKALPENATEKPKKQTEKKERVFNGRKKLKFSFKEQREYDTIDDEIADLEEQIRLTETEITASVSDYVKLQELSDRKEELEVLLAEKMERWVYLNDLAERIANGEME